MRVALISSRYQPESSPGAKRASDLVAALRAAGHDVTVLTQLPNYPDPTAFEYEPPERGDVVIEEDGAENATWRFVPRLVPKDDLIGRLRSEARFARQVSRSRTRLSDFDGVVASTPFVFNLRAARSYRVPMWLDVRDLTWEYARDLGPRSPLKRIGAAALRSIALRSLRAASGVSTTTEGQRGYLIDRGLPAERVRVVPNGVPRSVIDELIRRSDTAADSPAAPLKVVYAGLLGFPQGLEFAVESMEDLAGEGIELHLFGDGAELQRLIEFRRTRDLRHVHVHGHVPYDEYLRVIATADILFASLRPEIRTAMPSKLLEYMAAGKPVLFAGCGEAAETVERTGAGISVPYGDTQMFQRSLRRLSSDVQLRGQLGATGRDWVVRHRVREDINQSWVRDIEETFASRGRRRSSGVPAAQERSEAGEPASGHGSSACVDAPPARNGRARLRGPLVRAASLMANGAELCGLLRLLERIEGGRAGRLRVLTYHRVTEADARPSPSPGLVSASPAAFAAQMEFLATAYRVVSVEDVLDALRGDRALPARALLLSFDDAYRDFAECAWPILKRCGLPVTLFVPTGFPDHPERVFWWDRLYQAMTATDAQRVETPDGTLSLRSEQERLRGFRWLRERVKARPHDEAMELVDRVCRELGPDRPVPAVLGWDELRSLAGQGVALGVHTRNHPLLDRISTDEVRSEVVGALEDLEREIGSTLPIFAYPAGRYNDEAVRVLAEAGIELAFTTRGGVNDLRRGDRLRLSRIQVGLRTTRPLLRTQLAGLHPPRWLRAAGNK